MDGLRDVGGVHVVVVRYITIVVLDLRQVVEYGAGRQLKLSQHFVLLSQISRRRRRNGNIQSGAEKKTRPPYSLRIIYVNCCSTSGFTLVPEIEYGYDTELIFFAILYMLNIPCDVTHAVINKQVYV